MPSASMVRPPRLLVRLAAEGRWCQPPDDRWAAVVPWLSGPENTLEVVAFTDLNGPVPSGLDHVVAPEFWSTCSAEVGAEPLDDPEKIDCGRGLVIAENRVPGADLAVVLDLRGNPDDPRVVASEWIGEGGEYRHVWRQISPTFSAFVRELGL